MTTENTQNSKHPAISPRSAWATWYIKIAYTYGQPKLIGHTVKARNQDEAERKAEAIVRGKCLGFSVFTAE